MAVGLRLKNENSSKITLLVFGGTLPNLCVNRSGFKVPLIAFPILLLFETKLYDFTVLTPVFQINVKTMRAHLRLGRLISKLWRSLKIQVYSLYQFSRS